MKSNSETYTADELARLPELLPELTETINGRTVPSLARDEAEQLIRRYPSHFRHVVAALEGRPPPPPPSAEPSEDDVLRARYPSMFAGK